MHRRALYIVLGTVLMVLGFMGMLLIQHQKDKEDALKQLEVLKQQQEVKTKEAAEQRAAQEARAKRAEEERKAEEHRIRAEQERKLAEVEKQRTLELQQKLAEEEKRRKEQEEKSRIEQEAARKQTEETRRREEEAARQQREKEQQQRQKEEQERRIAAQKEMDLRAKTTLIQFQLYPDEARKTRVAVVHLGDQISVRVKRGAGANEKLYLGLGPLEQYGQLHWMEKVRMRAPAGMYRAGTIPGSSPGEYYEERELPFVGPVTFPNQPVFVQKSINDQDRMTVTLDSNDPKFIQCLQTSDGVVLYVGTALGLTPGYVSARSAGQGAYEVEVSIYRNNQWDMAARSLR